MCAVTCNPLVRIVKMRTVVDEEVFDVGENLVHHLQSNVGDYSWIFNHVRQAALHQLGMAHLAWFYADTHTIEQLINLRTLKLFLQYKYFIKG